MSCKVDFEGKKILAIITGASQGIGRQIGVELVNRCKSEVFLLLLARSRTGLEQSQQIVKQANPGAQVAIFPIDLTEPDANAFVKALDAAGCAFEPDVSVIFHNVGQIGTLKPALQLTDAKAWQNFYNLNLFSVALMNSIFVNKFKTSKIHAVNITSLCGRQPFKDMAMYGSGKAARELFFRVLAEEQPEIGVLNYSPGPVDTPMIAEVIDRMTNAEMKSVFVEMKEKKTILTCEQTVNKLFDVLSAGDYKSGDTIDYYDRI